jgi:hypothetical protein
LHHSRDAFLLIICEPCHDPNIAKADIVFFREYGMPTANIVTRESLRLLAMLLALSIGVLLVADLWRQSLSQESLATAGRGVIFVLLALGLMGTRRLSVALTALLCGVSLLDLLTVNHTLRLVDVLEIPTLLICAGLLLAPEHPLQDQHSAP